METDPQVVALQAAAQEDENWRFRTFVKTLLRMPEGRLDALAERLGREAEARMDCTSCGACCRANHVPVSDKEVARLAERIHLDVAAFGERYLDRDDDDHQALDANPCPFLAERICSVYEDRPEACRGYPYIGGNIRSRMIGIIERASCPIVFEMLEQLKRHLGFRRLL